MNHSTLFNAVVAGARIGKNVVQKNIFFYHPLSSCRAKKIRQRKKKMACEFCTLDRVEFANVPRCIALTISGLWTDLSDGKMGVTDALRKDDRILYLLGLLIIALTVRLVSF